MRPCFFYSLLVLVFACKGKPGTEPQTNVLGKDSAVTEPKKEQRYSYHVEGNLFIVRDSQRKVADTLELDPEDYSGYTIVDMTDSLQFANLLLQLNWVGDSDYRNSEFIEYQGDSLKLLLGIGYLNVIRRKDANTLVGLASDRDEVVNTFQDDYPFTISLLNYTVAYEKPDVQYIGFTSEVLESFEAYYLNNKGDTIPIIVNSGINITIDSIYRNSKTVRISYKDFPVYTEIENIKYKITTNTAG